MARFGPPRPHPLGGAGPGVVLEVRPARTVHFSENFIKQKLQGDPDLVGAGQVRSGAGPHLGPQYLRRSVQPEQSISMQIS